MATFDSTLNGYGANLLRWYDMSNASGGTITNRKNPGTNDATYAGTSVTVNNDGPISTMKALTMAGSDALITVPSDTDINALAECTALFVCNITGRTDASSRIFARTGFDDWFSIWTAGPLINFRKQGSAGGGRHFDSSNNWNDSLGWILFAFRWDGDSALPAPQDYIFGFYGTVGGTVTQMTNSSTDDITGSVTNNNDLNVWSDSATSNRVTLGSIAHFAILDLALTSAQLDTLATLAGTEPSSGPSVGQQLSASSMPLIRRRRRTG